MRMLSVILVDGTEYDLVHRETVKRIHAAQSVHEIQGFAHKARQCICFFHAAPLQGRVKKADAVLWKRSLQRGRLTYSALLSLSTFY